MTEYFAVLGLSDIKIEDGQFLPMAILIIGVLILKHFISISTVVVQNKFSLSAHAKLAAMFLDGYVRLPYLQRKMLIRSKQTYSRNLRNMFFDGILNATWRYSSGRAHGDQEGTAYNGHFGCSCYHPLFLFNHMGDLERSRLRPGNVHSADGWRDVLVAEVAVPHALLRDILERIDRLRRPTPATA